MKISLAMIVKNEEEVLSECLNSVKDIVDEMVLVDTGSKDNTVNIAKEFGAKLYEFKWCNDFSLARNFAAEKCSGDWILVLDADEVVTLGNKKVLIDFAKEKSNNIGKIQIFNKYKEGEEICFSTEYISRFYPRGILYKGAIHEQLNTDLPRINMKFRVDHSGYFEKDKSERNLDILFKEFKNNKEDPYVLYQLAHTLRIAKRYEEAEVYFKMCYEKIHINYSFEKSFIISYIYNIINTKKFSDGIDLIEKYKTRYLNSTDFNFACGIFYMNLILSNVNLYGEMIHFIEESYLRCLDIGEDPGNTVVGVGTFKAAYNLGVYYETTGNISMAKKYYLLSSKYDYEPALNRLKFLEQY